MFAAKAGAKLVIGIDMSNILDQAKKIVEANGLSDSEWLLARTNDRCNHAKTPFCAQRSPSSRASSRMWFCRLTASISSFQRWVWAPQGRLS
jgi:hypothetical protein